MDPELFRGEGGSDMHGSRIVSGRGAYRQTCVGYGIPSIFEKGRLKVQILKCFGNLD